MQADVKRFARGRCVNCYPAERRTDLDRSRGSSQLRSGCVLRMVSPSNDNSAIAILRLTLDELFTDHRFFVRQSMSAGQGADYILTLVQQGERDLDVLKASAF